MNRTIVFDLDGTLVDTAPDLINALNHVLDREGLPPIPLAAARNAFGSRTTAPSGVTASAGDSRRRAAPAAVTVP